MTTAMTANKTTTTIMIIVVFTLSGSVPLGTLLLSEKKFEKLSQYK